MFILIGIGIISLPILLKQLRIPESDVVIKATGAQWYWSYDYPQHDFSFDSVMLEKEELEQLRLDQSPVSKETREEPLLEHRRSRRNNFLDVLFLFTPLRDGRICGARRSAQY